MHTEHLGAALRIFVIGFGGVFLNLTLLMCALKVIGWTAVRSEQKKKAAEKAAAEKAAQEKEKEPEKEPESKKE